MEPTLVGNYDDELGIRTIVLGYDAARIVLPMLLALIVALVFKRYRTRRAALVASAAGLVVGVALYISELPPLNILNPIFDAPQAHVFEDRASPTQAITSKYRRDGYNGVKLYDGLTERQFLAAVSAAEREGLYSVGHLLNQVPLEV
ncbi:MAG: hypothetical protein QNJ20_15170 [Paracoccaceae bacterium]|nr:hypothetical protein [Paracoccaceae bacterium]